MNGVLGILVALGLLIFLAYRGVSVLILGPTMALVAIWLSGGLPFLASFTQIFMPALGDFIILFFPLFLLGAIFGTTPFASPGLGIITGLAMFALGMFWLNRCANLAKAAGEGYGAHTDILPAPEAPLWFHQNRGGSRNLGCHYRSDHIHTVRCCR